MNTNEGEKVGIEVEVRPVEVQQPRKNKIRALMIGLWVAVGVMVLLIAGIAGMMWAQRQRAEQAGVMVDEEEEPVETVWDKLVPVVGWDDARVGLTGAEVAEFRAGESDFEMVPLREVDRTRRLLMVDGVFALDEVPQEEVLTINQTGTTALARGMQRVLEQVGDPLHFTQHIGEFLARADYTHTSNEVSFLAGCQPSGMSFCAPMAMLEVLKDSGMNIISLTGNHGVDRGAAAMINTLDIYEELGWHIVGGGRNLEEARQPLIIDAKGVDIAWLGYNNVNLAGDVQAAAANRPGANPFSWAQAEADIAAAKEAGKFVIVDIQYLECWSYPQGYVEYTQCDPPMPGQTTMFRRLADLGADLVVGVSAHQPQTFELYDGRLLFYGLGNLFFDQHNWPGTERGLILTHYFVEGRHVQTRVTPTRFDRMMAPWKLDQETAEWFLARLIRARPTPAVAAGTPIERAVSSWAGTQDVSVAIYDLVEGKWLVRHRSDVSRDGASLYKLGVAIRGYQAVDQGERRLADNLMPGRTWGDCLVAAVATSNSPCAEALHARLIGGAVQLATTAEQTTEVLRQIWRGEDLSTESRKMLMDSMRGRPELYERGLPSSLQGTVYGAVGWSPTAWNDAVIVTDGDKAYAITVLSAGMGFSNVRTLGQQLNGLLF